MNEQRARENSAYVRKLLSEREPEFAAALAAAERYISWSFRPGGDEDRDDPPMQRFRHGHAVTDGHAPGKQTAFASPQREHSPLSVSWSRVDLSLVHADVIDEHGLREGDLGVQDGRRHMAEVAGWLRWKPGHLG